MDTSDRKNEGQLDMPDRKTDSSNQEKTKISKEEANSLGERLRYARKKRGYTQDSLAEAIGVSRGVIFNLEKNKTDPQAIVINAICQTLNINKDWLTDGKGEMDKTSEVSQSARILTELYQVAKELSEDEQLYLLDTVKALKQRLCRKPK